MNMKSLFCSLCDTKDTFLGAWGTGSKSCKARGVPASSLTFLIRYRYIALPMMISKPSGRHLNFQFVLALILTSSHGFSEVTCGWYSLKVDDQVGCIFSFIPFPFLSELFHFYLAYILGFHIIKYIIGGKKSSTAKSIVWKQIPLTIVANTCIYLSQNILPYYYFLHSKTSWKIVCFYSIPFMVF